MRRTIDIFYGVAQEKGDTQLTFTIFLGMRAIKINLWAKARKRPALYYYSPTSMEFIYDKRQLLFKWFFGVITSKKKYIEDTD